MSKFSNQTTELLDKMTADERRSLSLFAQDKYFNNRTEVVVLLDVVLGLLYKNIENEHINKTQLLKKWVKSAYPKKAAKKEKDDAAKKEAEKDEANFNAAMSKLKALILDFFVINHIKTDPLLKKRYLLEELRRRNLKDFIKPQEHIKKDTTVESTDIYITNWQIEDHIDRYYEALLYRSPTAKNNIEPAAQALDTAFLVNKLRYMCIALNHNRVLGTENEDKKIRICGESFVLDWLKSNTYYTEKHPLLNAFYLLWLMLENIADNDRFHTAHHFVETHQEAFAPLDLDTIYSLLTNYALKQNNTGNKKFAAISLQLYLNGFAEGYFHRDNATMVSIYKNVIKLSIQCQQTNTAIDFLDKLRAHAGIDEAVYIYCLALVDFQKKDYTKVINDIKVLQFNDNHNKIDNHILLLRAYFCAKHIGEFKTQLQTTHRFIERAESKAKITNYEYYRNFVQVFTKVALYKEQVQFPSKDYDIVEKQRSIQQEIQDTTPIFYKIWLEEQLLNQ
jgi:hypothetical protein